MHVAPVVVVPHRLGPAGWTESVEALLDALERHPDLVVTVRIPGAALDHVRQEDAWARLPRRRIRWLAGGWSDPILTLLPPRAQNLQLNREAAVMDAAGIAPAGLWLGDAWEPGMVDLARQSGHPVVYLDHRLFEEVPSRPGAIERAGEVVMGVVVGDRLAGSADPDGLAAVRVDASDLHSLATERRGSIASVDTYLEDHLPGDRLAPRVTSPAPLGDKELFYRKLLLVTADQGERTSGLDSALAIQSREYLLEDGHDASEMLFSLRRALDARRRGDSWVDIEESDWDADGVPEVRVETATTSLLVDPAEATLRVWDHKPTGWSITQLASARSGQLIRRLDSDDREPPSLPLRLEGRSEGKGLAEMRLEGGDSTSCRLELRVATLTIDITVTASSPMRVGPEIPLNMAEAEVRADGGAWIDTAQPVALAGHRFRITDGDRSLVLATPRPSELFVTPVPEGGLILWPHWLTADGGTYRVSFTPS